MNKTKLIGIVLATIGVAILIVIGVRIIIASNLKKDFENRKNSQGYVQIFSIEQLQGINKNLEAKYILMQDLSFSSKESSSANNANQSNFASIGTKRKPRYNLESQTVKGNGFTGIFDGNNKSISGLIIDERNEDFVGLFSYLDNQAIIKDLTLNDPIIRGKDFVGSIAGYSDDGTQISNVTITGGAILGKSMVGGIVGKNHYGFTVSGKVLANVEGDFIVGGIIGENFGGEVLGYVSGIVQGKEIIGGLVGNDAGIVKGLVEGTVVGDETIGGLVGVQNEGTAIGVVLAKVNGLRVVGALVGSAGALYDDDNNKLTSNNTVPTQKTYSFVYGNWDVSLVGQSLSVGKIYALQDFSIGFSSIRNLQFNGSAFIDTKTNRQVFIGEKIENLFSISEEYDYEKANKNSLYKELLYIKNFEEKEKIDSASSKQK